MPIEGAPVRVVNFSETPQAAAPIVNIPGAVSLPTYEDQRVFDGAGYTVSTSITAVASGNYLIAELANPAGSGVEFVMTSRVFSDNIAGGAAPLEYVRYVGSAFLAASPAPTTTPINNRRAGGPASTGTFRFHMGPNLPVTSSGGSTVAGSTSSGFIPTNGEEKRIKDIVIIPPGQKLIYSVGGMGGGLAASARIVMTFLFYTRSAS